MLGSKFCILHGKTPEERMNQFFECPMDVGGPLIIKGTEYSLEFVESVKLNELQLRNETKKRLIRGFVISKPGDTFESSYQADITFKYKEAQITVSIKEYERLDVFEIPFYLIFKMFDIVNEVEMV